MALLLLLLLFWGSRDSKGNKIGYYSFRICVCYEDHTGFLKTHLISIQEISISSQEKQIEVYQ